MITYLCIADRNSSVGEGTSSDIPCEDVRRQRTSDPREKQAVQSSKLICAFDTTLRPFAVLLTVVCDSTHW